MIKTEVTSISAHEHRVDVTVAQSEYQRLHQEKLNDLMAKNVRLPGFRPGKVPRNVIAQKFADHLRQEVISGLLDSHYTSALEQSGLQPAIQPILDIPTSESEDFIFNITVTSWPEVKFCPWNELDVEAWNVSVGDADVNGVISRLMESQFRFHEEDKAAENNDKLILDYVGYLGDEAFDGGSATDAELVLGSNQYIPGFEEQLIGAKAGDHVQVEVQFPDNYQAGALAGQQARFEVDVKAVMHGVACADENDLADLLGFADGAALREDAKKNLLAEAEKAAWEKNRSAVEAAILAKHDIPAPDNIVNTHVEQSLKRYAERRSQSGEAAMSDQEVQAFIAQSRPLEVDKVRLTAIYRVLAEQGALDASEDEVRAEVEKLAAQYPEGERQSYVDWMMSNQQYRSPIESTVLERKCVDYVLSVANVTTVEKTITELQDEIDAEEAASSDQA